MKRVAVCVLILLSCEQPHDSRMRDRASAEVEATTLLGAVASCSGEVHNHRGEGCDDDPTGGYICRGGSNVFVTCPPNKHRPCELAGQR